METAGISRTFEFVGFRLDAAQRRLISPDGAPVELSSRAFDLLLHMVERPGDLLEKSALLKAVWPASVVEEGNLSQTVFNLRRALGDSGNEHRFIATVPGRGYQFVAPVVVHDDTGSAHTPPHASARSRAWPWLAAAAVLAGIVLLALLSWPRVDDARESATQSSASGAALPSVAVLPFADLSPTKDMEYFADGVAEEIMNSLSRVGSLQVIGRRSAFAFKGKDDDARSIGEKLKVDSILEGSVRKAGDRIRITAHLVRTRDGFTLWSETFDRKLDDVLDVQGAVAREVVSALSPVVGSPGATASVVPATKNADAYNAYLRGIHLFGRGTYLDYPRARVEFQRATDLDPDFALAHAWLGRSIAWLARMGVGDMVRDRALGDASLERALELDPQLADLWWVRTWPTNFENLSLAVRANILERSLANDRSDPAPMLDLAFIYILMGRRDEVLELHQRAYEADPLWPNTLISGAQSNYGFGDRARTDRLLSELESIAPDDPRAADHRALMAFSEGRALDWDRFKARALAIAPRNLPLHGYLSRDYAYLGIVDAALYHAEKSQNLSPESAVGDYNIAHVHLFSGNIEAARPVVRRAIAERPNDYFAQVAQADLYYFTGNCSAAVNLIELARPAFRHPVGSLDLVTDRQDVPIFVWCLRLQGNDARAKELTRAFEIQFQGVTPGLFDGLKARVAAAAGDREALLTHLRTVVKSRSMDFAFARHEPMIQPYLNDPDVSRLLDTIDDRRAEWRKIIPKSSMHVPIPDAPKVAGS